MSGSWGYKCRLITCAGEPLPEKTLRKLIPRKSRNGVTLTSNFGLFNGFVYWNCLLNHFARCLYNYSTRSSRLDYVGRCRGRGQGTFTLPNWTPSSVVILNVPRSNALRRKWFLVAGHHLYIYNLKMSVGSVVVDLSRDGNIFSNLLWTLICFYAFGSSLFWWCFAWCLWSCLWLMFAYCINVSDRWFWVFGCWRCIH